MFPGTVSQHGGLLHQSPDREEDLHALHGCVQRHLHLNVRPRDGLSHRQAHLQSDKHPKREPEADVRRPARTHHHRASQVPVPQGGPHASREPAEPKQEGEGQGTTENHCSVAGDNQQD